MSIEQNFLTKIILQRSVAKVCIVLVPSNTAVKNVTNTYACICACIGMACARERCAYIERLSGSTFVSQLFLTILDGYRRPQAIGGFNVSSFVQMLLTGNLN